MADKRVTYPYFKAFTSSGAFAASYEVYTYEAGTSTPNATYTDSALSVAHDNPIVLDSSGEAEIYLAESTKFVLKDTDGVTIWTCDNIDPTTWDADEISYSNTTSGLTATDVQAAIDEVVVNLNAVAAKGSTYNRVINSEMMIDQRNEGATVAANGAYGVDRWYNTVQNTDELVFTLGRSTGIGGMRNSLLFTATTAETALADDERIEPFKYKFLGYDVADMDSAVVTLSFYFKAAEAGTYSIAILNGVGSRAYITDFTYSVAAAVQLVTKTVALESNSISNTTTGTGLLLRIASTSGADYQTSTTGSWVTGNYSNSTAATNWSDTVNNYVQISGVQLVVGNNVGDFAFKSRDEYLQECLPYYRKSFDQEVKPAQNTGDDNGALTYYVQEANTADGVQVNFNIPMVGAPTVTYYNVDAANAKWRNATDAGDSGTAATVSAGVSGFFAQNPSVATDGVGEKIYVHYSADAEI